MNVKIFKFSIRCILPLMMMMNVSAAMAQTKVEGSVQSITVKENNKYLFVELRGGDGADNNPVKANNTIKGGQGASLKVYLKIGNGVNEVAPGGTLRLIPGNAGKSAKYSGGGGGGTAIAYQAPEKSNWVILAVAGGGGGAGYTTGKPGATTSDNGQAGKESSKSGMKSKAYGGGGAYSSSSSEDCSGKAGIANSIPYKAPGGSGCDGNGGAGFGSGGSGKVTHNTQSIGSGGGGGGYEGGNGNHGAGANGGGSYINSVYFARAFSIMNGTTDSPKDGYISYQYLSNLPTGPALQLSAYTDKCIVVESEDLHNGNNIQLSDCVSNDKTQSWEFNNYEIKTIFDVDKCMNVDGASTQNGTNIRIKNCNNTNAQKWIYDGLTKNIRSHVNTEKCIDLVNAKTNNGNNIQLWDCKSIVAQRWTIEGATTISNPSSAKYIVPATNTDIAFQSILGARSGSSVRLGTKDDSNKNTEQWKLDGINIKYSTSQDLCLSAAQFDNGSDIQLRSCANTPFQQWVYNGLTQQIHSAQAPSKCIEIQAIGDNFANGQNIYLMDCNEVARQKFDIK